MKTNVT